MTIELNDEQRSAAECLDRPVLVTAGAGSGKTRMLTQRFVNAVVPGQIVGWDAAGVGEIVAITFTEKAAGEIADRVRLALAGAGLDEAARSMADAWISTIHGLCSRLLRRHPFEAGVDPLFAVADAVLVGELRAEAFDSASRELLAADADVDRLFERYGFDTVFAAAVEIARRLAVLGVGAEELVLEPVRPVGTLVGEARELFRRGMTTCDLGYNGTSQAPAEHARNCEELLGRCSRLASAQDEDSEVLAELLAALKAYSPLRKLKGLEEVAAGLKEEAERLTGDVAGALTAPYAAALKRLASAYAFAFAKRKEAAGTLDFDDLQLKAVELLERNEALAERYRDRFRVVMIDEFQDTDALQLRLMEAITRDDLCTVGDEKQSIYRFRGADVDVYREHQASMRERGALVVPLDVNYRSHPDLLAFVNAAFGSDEYFGGDLLRLKPPAQGHAENRFDAVLGDPPRVEVVFVDKTDDADGAARAEEARAVARRLGELYRAGARLGDMAILMRSYRPAHVYAEALADEGLSAVIVGGNRFFGLAEIAIMRALTRVVANPEDDAALGLLLASDFVPFTSDALVRLRFAAGPRERAPLWALLGATSVELEGDDGEARRRLVAVVDGALGRLDRMPLSHVLLLAVEEAGWDIRLLSAGNVGRDAFANVLKFVRQASEFEASHSGGPGAFARHLDTKERLGESEAPASLSDDKSDAVRIMSIHASKGLEFPIVVVPELGAARRGDRQGVRTERSGDSLAVALKTPPTETGEPRANSAWFSAFSRRDGQASAEEDARVLYVAFTRAQEFLIASGAMRLHTQKPTTATSDIAKLTRVLDVATPVDGPMDLVRPVPGTGVACRVRVIERDSAVAAETVPAGAGAVVVPPAAGAPLSAGLDRAIPTRLSYTQLSEFEHCPRQFWLRRVLGARASSIDPEGETGPLEFGNALHAALRLVSAQGEPPSAERLDAIARYFKLSGSDAERLSAAVGRFCSSPTARLVRTAAVVRREAPFSLAPGEGPFLITGAIDLYARTGDSVLVVDYKSGSTGEASELGDRYRLQAECYALAALMDGASAVRVVFVRPEVESADGAMQMVAFEFAATDGDRIERGLVERYDEIARSGFSATPSQECAHCDARGTCPSAI